MDQRSGGNLGRRHQVGAINPQVSGPQSRRAAMGHGYDWNGVGQGFLARVKRLSYAGCGAWRVLTLVILSEQRNDESKDPYRRGSRSLLRRGLVCLDGLFFGGFGAVPGLGVLR